MAKANIITDFPALKDCMLNAIKGYQEGKKLPLGLDGLFHGDTGRKRASTAQFYLNKTNSEVAILGILSMIVNSSSTRLSGLIAKNLFNASYYNTATSSVIKSVSSPAIDEDLLKQLKGKHTCTTTTDIAAIQSLDNQGFLQEVLKLAVLKLSKEDKTTHDTFLKNLKNIPLKVKILPLNILPENAVVANHSSCDY